MPTKKKPATPKPPHSEAYDAALVDYAAALDLLQKGNAAAAREKLAEIESSQRDEPELAERARSYMRICDRKLAPGPEAPTTPDDCYHRAVMLSNLGEWNEAIGLLDRALQQQPNSVDSLYARASAWALSGRGDKAVTDLRQAISLEPKVRFQAVNDPDFERIREEPAFIDIIEPTPTGA